MGPRPRSARAVRGPLHGGHGAARSRREADDLGGAPGEAAHHGLASVIDAEPAAEDLHLAAYRAFELLETKGRAEARGRSLRRYRYELGELLDIARAMTTVRDVDKLLGVILEKSRFVTGADAGSIYTVERAPGDGGATVLRFRLTQNESVSFDSREFTMPLSDRSMAGSAALKKTSLRIPDVYDLPAGSTFQFDPSLDRRTGYVTRSMLVAPLISQRDEVIGVIQLINKKRDPSHRLLTRADVDSQVIAFDERSEELLGMLAAQAGVSLETAILYGDIRTMFDGFVKASVEAIESRDPTTSGHSRRVAELTVGLAKVVDGETTGQYADASFKPEDLRELEYASLLHDFGKIGVREKVLVKAKKLYEERLELVRARFDYVARSIEADVLGRKVRVLEAGGSRADLDALDRELAQRRADIDGAWEAICSANEPTVLSSGDFQRIEAIGRETFVDLRGETRARSSTRRGDHLLLGGEPRLAHDAVVLRDPVAGVAPVPVPVADPLGEGAEPRPDHRRRAPREAERHGLPEPPARGGDPRAIEDDGRGRHLRRADGERPPLQEGRPDRQGSGHPGLQRQGRAPRRGARPDLQGSEDLGARARADAEVHARGSATGSHRGATPGPARVSSTSAPRASSEA